MSDQINEALLDVYNDVGGGSPYNRAPKPTEVKDTEFDNVSGFAATQGIYQAFAPELEEIKKQIKETLVELNQDKDVPIFWQEIPDPTDDDAMGVLLEGLTEEGE